MRHIWWLVPATLVIGACKKKEDAKGAETPAAESAATPGAVETPAEPAVPALSPEERAAKYGFARHLPQDTAVVMSLYNGTKQASRIKSSKLWKLISEEMDMDVSEEESADAEPTGPAALFAREFTVAVGSAAGPQTANLIKLRNRLTHFQMRAVAAALAECAESGDFSNFAMAMAQRFSGSGGMFIDLLKDPEGGIALFEQMKMPPLYVAFGGTPENREALAQQLASSIEVMAFLGEVAEPVEVEINGATFAGYKISGAKVSEQMAGERESMEMMLDAELVDRLIAEIAKKDLVVMTGLVGDHALWFAGSSTDDLVLATDLGDSIVSGDALAFADRYASKDLAALVYGRKEAIAQMSGKVSAFADMASGLREGIAGAESLGDTRDLQALLQMVGEREKTLMALIQTEAAGTVAFIEDGLKIESFGGNDNGTIDWQAANRLAGLKDSANLALFCNVTGNKAYSEMLQSYMEALTETAYALAMKVAEFPMEDDDMLQYREMAGLFDRTFRRDAVAVWDALSDDFASALGGESAILIDLNGSPPTIPGVPQNIVDEGKFPRVTMVAPVTDRAKLASAWQKIDDSATKIMANISEMSGTDIPMQKPMNSERDGFTTWFFPVPFFSDDFLPSVTVGDEWFAASTSKNQALDLLAKAGSGETTQGLTFFINFDAMREFASLTTDLLEKNPDAVPLEESDFEEIRKLIAAMEEIERLSLHMRKEGGQIRTSMHLKTR